jgi:aspartate/methionine/tyrosine aminotransferase
MSFVTIDYLSWYVPRIRGGPSPLNLHASGVAPLDEADYRQDSYDPWQVRAQFEAELAQWLNLPPREVVATTGATGGTLLALLSLVGPGGQVLVEQPIYEPMLRQAQRTAQVDRLVRYDHEGWRLSPARIAQQLNDHTQLVMITEPHNPSGCFAPADEVEQLADLCQQQGAILLINEVYRGYSDRASYHRLRDNVVIVSSFSKLLGTYWARLGWLSGTERLATTLRQGQLNYSQNSSPAAALGRALLPRATVLQAQAQQAARQGQPVVQRWLDGRQDLSWCAPQGPGFGCLRLPAGVNDLELVERLHREHSVLVIPGTLFEAPGTIRVSWLQGGPNLEQGLQAIGQVMDHTRGT